MSDMYQPPQEPVVEEKTSGLAIAALIFGILGFCCGCTFLAGIPAIICGFIENGKIKNGEHSVKGKGFAIAGMVLGILAVLLGCVQIVWIIFFGGLQALQGMGRNF